LSSRFVSMSLLRDCLAVGFVASASAVLCDGSGGKGKVPCVDLASGLQMPAIAMGSWPGSYKDCDTTDFTCVNQHARFAIDNWLHIGGRHVDAANDYRTQTSVGQALASSKLAREDYFLTTKCPGGIGYEATIQCADDNLQMLQQLDENGFSYIDLLLLHWPKKFKPVCRFNAHHPDCADSKFVPASKEELLDTWRAMEELKRIGVVKSIGVSNYNITQLQWTLEVATEQIDVNQVDWNPKEHDDDLLRFCEQHGITLEAWSPLGGKAGSVLSDPVIAKIAQGHGVSTAQVTLRWSVQQGVVPVVGSANAAHQISDMDLFGFNLTSDEMDQISALGDGMKTLV